ncbi:MAG: protein mraZ [Salinivirgaceae bacterium]|jgi:MraZ protein|nr:protein mraZ [Salinivirgaceae bacterium]
MAYFIGDHTCKLDTKGRILFPAALKKQLAGGAERFVVKKDLFENCLVLYTNAEWERQNQLIRARTNPFNKEHNRFVRGFSRGTAEIILDGSSRMLIPKRLLEIIGGDKEIVLSGQDSKIEIWNKQVYDGLEEEESDFANLAEQIMQIPQNSED